MSPCRLLVADVDGTLLGDDEALARLRRAMRAAGIALIANSSRPLGSLRATGDLDALGAHATIGALGTEIDWPDGPDTAWAQTFADFPRTEVGAVLSRFGPAHEASLQAPAKVSHHVDPADWGPARHAVAHLGRDLRVVTSGRTNLDVIPRGAGKTAAARHAARRCQVEWANVVTAGDAEIDAGMLLAARGIAVGNSTRALRQRVAGQVFQAVGRHADGVIEGLAHYAALEPGRAHA